MCFGTNSHLFGCFRFRSDYYLKLIRVRLRSESEASEDGRSLKKFVFSVGRNDLFVQLPVRTVASLPKVPEVSFVS